MEDAKGLAAVDADQVFIQAILAFRGDPLKRTSMSFLVVFIDGDQQWVDWSQDLFNTALYETFCSSHPALRPLLGTASEATKWLTAQRKTPITAVSPGVTVFVELRAFGADWYQTLNIPNPHTHFYFVVCIYKQWKVASRTIELSIPLFRHTLIVDSVFVYMWGSVRNAPVEDSATLISQSFLTEYPISLSKPKAHTLREFQYLVGKTFHDEGVTYEVTRIAQTKSGDIVAYVRRPMALGRPSLPEERRPYHVAEVVRLISLLNEDGGEGGEEVLLQRPTAAA